MAAVDRGAALRIPPEGRLAVHPLPQLLGPLGLVRATGLLELTRRRLALRVVLDEGVIAAVVSNARDDRFFEWLLTHADHGPALVTRADDLATALGDAPLCAARLAALGALDAALAPQLLREHAVAQLRTLGAARDATFAIRPGRVALGDEWRVDWPALDAALVLARELPAQVALPERVVRREAPPGLDLAPLEARVLAACAEPMPSRAFHGRFEGADPGAAVQAVSRLLAVGLLAALAAPAAEDDAGRATVVTVEEIEAWLAAAAAENLHALVGVAAGATTDEVRRAYYRAVRRFHPDRYRTGPHAPYRDRIEGAFRLLHEALAVLTDPAARSAWEKRRQGPAQIDPARVARERGEQAYAAMAAGRRAEAIDALEAAASADPREPVYALRLALLLLGNPRRRAEAAERLAALARAHPGRADLLSAAALGAARCGRPDEARPLTARALAADGAEPVARALAGDPEALRIVRADPFLAPLFPQT